MKTALMIAKLVVLHFAKSDSMPLLDSEDQLKVFASTMLKNNVFQLQMLVRIVNSDVKVDFQLEILDQQWVQEHRIQELGPKLRDHLTTHRVVKKEI